jgi:hypothetical protein
MPKLHELLAVDSDVKGQLNKVRTDLVKTFNDKRHLFTEVHVTTTPLTVAEGENGDPVTTQQSSIQTNVMDELSWISDIWARCLNVELGIDEGNTKARADVVLEDGTTFLSNVPATSLLQMEKRLTELSHFIKAIPTLDPAKGFQPDPSRPNLYVARETTKTTTKKTQKALVLYPATDKHPAQTQLVTEDVPVAKEVSREWSGMTTPQVKGDMIDRCEELLRAVKRARSRANTQEVEPAKDGAKILSYVFGVKAKTKA